MKSLAVLLCLLCASAHSQVLVFDPGEGVETNVVEALHGYDALNVASGRVTLHSRWNTFGGEVNVRDGAFFGVQSAKIGEPSSLGLNLSLVTLGKGSVFDYSGTAEAETSAAFRFEAGNQGESAVVRTAGDFSTTGIVVSSGGAFVKRGPGRFTVATAKQGAIVTNYLACAVTAGPEIYVEEGTLEFAGDDATVRNLIGDGTIRGTDHVSIGQEGKRASLDITSGNNYVFANYIYVNDNAASSALNVHGGNLESKSDNSTIVVGYRKHSDDMALGNASFNIFGGKVNYQYLQLSSSRGGKSKLLVAGGTLAGYGLYVAHSLGAPSADNQRVSEAEIHVCTNGVISTTMQQLARNSETKVLYKVTDGGTVNLSQPLQASQKCTCTLLLDGGILNFNGNSDNSTNTIPAFVTTAIGEKQSTVFLKHDREYRFMGRVVSALESGIDGGLKFIGATGRIAFWQGATHTGPTQIDEGMSLVLYRDLSLAKLVSPFKRTSLVYVFDSGSMPVLSLGDVERDYSFRLGFEGVVPDGTYDVASFPLSAGISERNFSLSDASSRSAVFTVRESGSRKIVAVTLAGSTASTHSWQNSSGGDFLDSGNWSQASSPSSGSAIAFSANSAADGTPVSLAGAFTAATVCFGASPGYRLYGEKLTIDNAGSPGTVSATKGKHEIANDLEFAGVARFEASPSSSELEVSGSISANAVEVNPFVETRTPSYDAGVVSFTGTSSYTGPLVVNSGKAVVSSIGDKGVASAAGAGDDIVVGFGTFEFAGGEGSSDRNFILDPADELYCPALSVAEDSLLALGGSISTVRGGFHKTGKGTLKLEGAGYVFGENAGIVGAFDGTTYTDGYLPSAYSPMRAFVGCVIGAGTMVWGKEGQVVECPQDLQIGGRTTRAAGKETHASLVIEGGVTSARVLTVGQDHGSAATAECQVLTNRLVVNGGVVDVSSRLSICNQSAFGSIQHSEYVQNGGVVNSYRYTAIGHRGDTDGLSTVRFVLNGGQFNTFGGEFYIGAHSPAPQVTVELNGGVFASYDNVGLRFSSAPKNGLAHVVYLNEGGTLRLKGGFTSAKSSYESGSSLVFNGGVYQPYGPYGAITHESNIKVGTSPARIDTSYAQSESLINVQGTWRTYGEEKDGGIVVTGNGAMDCAVLFDSKVDLQIEGDIVAGNGGVILTRSEKFKDKRVVVQNGGSFGGMSGGSALLEIKVKDLTLEDGAGISVISHSKTITSVVRAERLEQKGVVNVTLIDVNKNYSLWLDGGTFRVVRAPKGSLDATKFRLSGRYDVASRANFTINTENAAYDELCVELLQGLASMQNVSLNAHTWTADGDGSFLDGGNWDVKPGDSDRDSVRFPETLESAMIGLGGVRTVGKIESDASGTVSLVGGEIDMGEGLLSEPTVVSRSGTLSLPSLRSGNAISLTTSPCSTQIVEGVLSAQKIKVNEFLNGGTLKLCGTLDSQTLEISSGTVQGAPEAFGEATVALANATVSFSGSGDNRAKISVAQNNDAVLDVRDGEVFSFKPLSASVNGSLTTIFKRGKGTLVFADGETSHWGSANKKNDTVDALWRYPENGDTLPDDSFGSIDVSAGKLVLGLNPNQRISTAGYIVIGSSMADFDENGDVIDSELEVRGGIVKSGATGGSDFYIGRNPGVYRYHKGLDCRRRNLTYSQYGGEFHCGTVYMSHDSPGYYNGKTTFNLYGGLFKSSSGYVQLSASRTSQGATYGTSSTEINIYGGVFTNTVYLAAQSNRGGLYTIPIGYCDLDINLYGGDFAWSAGIVASLGNHTKTRINFAGGKMVARYLRRDTTYGELTLFWNGGIFHPTLESATLKGLTAESKLGKDYSYNIVSTNGAIFEVASGRTFTVDQPFTSDEALEGGMDGGVAAIGGGTLVLATANAFTGPVRALGGTVLCGNVGAIPEGVALELSGGRIDLNGHPAIVGDVYGSGGEVFGAELAVEGTVRVIGETGGSLVLGNAVFGALSKFAPRYGPDGETGGWRGDTLKLANASGRIAIDLGRTPETTLEKGFLLKVAELDSASSANLRFVAVNYGDEKRLVAQFNRVVRDDGTVDVYVELVRKRFAIVVR